LLIEYGTEGQEAECNNRDTNNDVESEFDLALTVQENLE
jgi:hypothetical protein